MICRVMLICWRQSAAWSDRGRLRRQIQGIRAAWKIKYLWSAVSVELTCTVGQRQYLQGIPCCHPALFTVNPVVADGLDGVFGIG